MSQRQKLLGLVSIVVVVVVAIALVNVAETNAQGPGNGPCAEHDDDTAQNGHGMMNNGMMGGNGNHGMMGQGMMEECGEHGMMQDGMMGQGMMQDGMMGQGMMQDGMMNDCECAETSPMWQGMMDGQSDDQSRGNGPNGDHNGHNHQGPQSNQSNQGNQGMGNMMMQAWTPPADLIPAETPFDLETAALIADAYIADWDDENLTLGEVMEFDNHFYATALEIDTERGAFEFLIDPVTGVVYTEPGPNMMWNLRYGQHADMMGDFTSDEDGVDLSVSEAEAVELAQAFLNDFNEDFVAASDDVETFYGYYTLHITQDGEIVGMVSVNGYTGQVWLHHWHGQFMGMRSQR